jgi:hypothetical protein
MSAGRAQAPTELLTSQDVKTIGFKDTLGTKLKDTRGMFSSSDPTAIVAQVDATVGNLDSASQGALTFFVSWIEY